MRPAARVLSVIAIAVAIGLLAFGLAHARSVVLVLIGAFLWLQSAGTARPKHVPLGMASIIIAALTVSLVMGPFAIVIIDQIYTAP